MTDSLSMQATTIKEESPTTMKTRNVAIEKKIYKMLAEICPVRLFDLKRHRTFLECFMQKKSYFILNRCELEVCVGYRTDMKSRTSKTSQ